MEAILNTDSLAQTLWNLEEARRADEASDSCEVVEALDWVASRQGLRGSYRGVLFAPTTCDRQEGLIVPTGENNSPSGAAVQHVLGEEAARTLIKWGRVSGYDYEAVWSAIGSRFGFTNYGTIEEAGGKFCCARCSVAWWRALEAGRPAGWETILNNGIKLLTESRAGGPRWKRYPFYYTVLVLTELPLDSAHKELRAVGSAVERAAARQATSTPEDRVRYVTLTRALEII